MVYPPYYRLAVFLLHLAAVTQSTTNLIFHTVFSNPCSNQCEETCIQSTSIFTEGDCYAGDRQYGLAGAAPQSRWHSYRVIDNGQVCKSTYLDALCMEQVSDCLDTDSLEDPFEKLWARPPVNSSTCLNKTVVRDQVLERELFDVHLDWCIPNDRTSNIFSYPQSSNYTTPLITERFYPDEESCMRGYQEIAIADLPTARIRPRYLADEDLCVTENRTRWGYGSLKLYCSNQAFYRQQYTDFECQSPSTPMRAGTCLRNFGQDSTTVERWSRIDCHQPTYFCKDVAAVAPYRYTRLERPSASPTNMPSGNPSTTPSTSGMPSQSPSWVPSWQPSISETPTLHPTASSSVTTSPSHKHSLVPSPLLHPTFAQSSTNLIFHTIFSNPCSDQCEETCSQSTNIFTEGDCYASNSQRALAGGALQSRWYSYRVINNTQVCKSTYLDALCTEQVSDCLDTDSLEDRLEKLWARPPANSSTCLNKTVVRDQVLELELFDVHLDWCIPNDRESNIFSYAQNYNYTIPLITERFYPDEESCLGGHQELPVTELPAARVRSRYFADEGLCVTENRTVWGYGSLKLYCNNQEFFRQQYSDFECQSPSILLRAGVCLRNFGLDGKTVERWSRIDCHLPTYFCKDVAAVAPYLYMRMERPSASPTNMPSGNPSTTPTMGGMPSQESPSLVPSLQPSISETPIHHPTSSSSVTTIPSHVHSLVPSATTSDSPSQRSISILLPASPSNNPSLTPSRQPPETPSLHPSWNPSKGPYNAPSRTPSAGPSISPTFLGVPTSNVSLAPSLPTLVPNNTETNTTRTSTTVTQKQEGGNTETIDREDAKDSDAVDVSKGSKRLSGLWLLQTLSWLPLVAAWANP